MFVKKTLTIISLFFAITIAAPVRDVHAADDAAMVIDAIVVRPLGLVAMVAGSALFIVSLPFTALSKSTGRAAEHFIYAPTRFTFRRPLGEFHPTDASFDTR